MNPGPHPAGAGRTLQPPMKTQPATIQVEVLRAFFYAGAVQSVGSQLELPAVLAVELIHGHKAREHKPEPAAEPAPSATQPAADTPSKPAPRRKAQERTA